MSHQATYSWNDPVEKFTTVELDTQVAGATTPTVVGTVGPAVQTFVVGGLPDGDYVFGATPINGTLRGPRSVFSATIASDVAPGAVSNFAVAIAAE